MGAAHPLEPLPAAGENCQSNEHMPRKSTLARLWYVGLRLLWSAYGIEYAELRARAQPLH